MARVLSQEQRTGRQESLPLSVPPGSKGFTLSGLIDAADLDDPTLSIETEVWGELGGVWRRLHRSTYECGPVGIDARTGLPGTRPPLRVSREASGAQPDNLRVVLTPSKRVSIGADLEPR